MLLALVSILAFAAIGYLGSSTSASFTAASDQMIVASEATSTTSTTTTIEEEKDDVTKVKMVKKVETKKAKGVER